MNSLSVRLTFPRFSRQLGQSATNATLRLTPGYRIHRRPGQQEEAGNSYQQHGQCSSLYQQDAVFEEEFRQHEDMGQYHHTEAGNTFNRQFGLADPGTDPSKHTRVSAPLAALCAWFPLLQAMPDDQRWAQYRYFANSYL